MYCLRILSSCQNHYLWSVVFDSAQKYIIKHSSTSGFRVNSCEFYTYGGNDTGRQRMISLLFDFIFVGSSLPHTNLYHSDVLNSLKSATDLSAS